MLVHSPGPLVAPRGHSAAGAGDAADGAAAILRLLSGDRKVQSSAAQAAADARVFNVEQHFEKLFEIYERIVQGRDRP